MVFHRMWFIHFFPDILPASDFYSPLVKKILQRASVINILLFSKACIHTHPSSPKLSAYLSTSAVAALHHRVLQHWQTSDWQRWHPRGTHPAVLSALPPGLSPNFQTIGPQGWALCEHSRAATQEGSRYSRFRGTYRVVHPLVFQWNFILEERCLIYNNMLLNIQKEAKGSSLRVEKKISIKMRSLKDDFFLAASCTWERSGHALQLECQNEQSYLRSSETCYLPQDHMKGKFTAL